MIETPRWWALTLAVVVTVALVVAVGILFRDGNPLGEDDPEVVSAAAAPPDDGGPESVLPPERQPGSPLVELSAQALVHPDGERLRILLQQHFDAINNGDYAAWARTVTAVQAKNTVAATWARQYRTTKDGSILVQHVQPELGTGLRVLVSFTSVQDPADAPADAPFRCLRWRVSYPVVFENGAFRVAPSDPDSSQRATC